MRKGEIADGLVKLFCTLSWEEVNSVTLQVKFKVDKFICLSALGSMNGMTEIFMFDEFIWEIFTPSIIRLSLNWIIIKPDGLIDFIWAVKFNKFK